MLNDIFFELKRGEAHVLLGENGAGKSTLIKILSGAYACDSGEIILDDLEMCGMTPVKSIQAGISVIYQELNMVPDMTIYENVFIGKEFSRGGVFDRKRQIKETRKYLDIIGLNVDPRVPARDLSIAQQQMVEIAKAISTNAKVLVLDEPTASITNKEVEILFGIVRSLKKKGLGIIYISHRLSELFEIGDRVSVLRDGSLIGTKYHVGARDEIYEIMLELTRQGASIIMISSDLVEIMKMCDRIAVMKEGEISAILKNDDIITQEMILSYAF